MSLPLVRRSEYDRACERRDDCLREVNRLRAAAAQLSEKMVRAGVIDPKAVRDGPGPGVDQLLALLVEAKAGATRYRDQRDSARSHRDQLIQEHGELDQLKRDRSQVLDSLAEVRADLTRALSDHHAAAAALRPTGIILEDGDTVADGIAVLVGELRAIRSAVAESVCHSRRILSTCDSMIGRGPAGSDLDSASPAAPISGGE